MIWLGSKMEVQTHEAVFNSKRKIMIVVHLNEQITAHDFCQYLQILYGGLSSFSHRSNFEMSKLTHFNWMRAIDAQSEYLCKKRKSGI